MSEETAPYDVSYIASAIEALSVGEIVEIVNAYDDFYQQKGRIHSNTVDNKVYVVFGLGEMRVYDVKDVRSCGYIETAEEKINPLEKQVGGNHYKKCKIQPIEYIHANGLDYFQGNIVKYITRFRDKNGREDLEKIKHYCDLLIQMEYPDGVSENAE